MQGLPKHVPVAPRFFTLMQYLGIEFPDGTLQTTAGGGGGGAVAAGTGITITGGNIVNIAASGVTPGDYSNASIAVNAEGQITSASSGAAGTPAAPSIATAPVGDFITSNGSGSVTDSGVALTNLPTHPGELMISQPGNTSVAFADPLVQGLYAAGSTIAAPPAYIAATTIQPILMGGSQSGVLQPALLDASGYLYVNIGAGTVAVTGTVAVSGSVAVTGTFWQATQPVSGTFWQATQPVSGTVAVTGTFWQATQPVSIAGTVAVSLASTTITGSVAVTGAFYQATQPVSGTFWQATQPVSGTVAISGSVAVTGTFWQATQPISGAISFTAPQHVIIDSGTLGTLTISGSVSVSNFPASQVVTLASTTITGSVAVTGTFWQATQPISSTQLPAVLDGSGFLKVHEQGTVPVTGTFWQATQPISGAVSFTAPQHVITDATSVTNATLSAETTKVIGTVNQGTSPWVVSMASTTITGSVAVTGTFWQATQPVSGTFWQATQPVSGTVAFSNTTIAVTNAGTFAVQAAQSGTWNIGTVTTVSAVTAITNALPAGTNTIGKVDILGNAGGILDTAKGTQASTAVGVQDLKDAGRNARVFMLDAYTAAPATEAMASVVQWYGNVAVGTTVSPAVVPAGKTLRLNSWKIMYQSLATVGYATVRVRINTAGTAVLSSPLAWSFECGSGAGATTAAMTGCVSTETGDFPEGFEIPAAAGVGFSIAGYGPAGVLTLEGGVRFAVYGYEY